MRLKRKRKDQPPLHFRDKLYLGGKVRKDYRKHLRKLKSGRPAFGLYLLTYAVHPEDQLDILNAEMLHLPLIRERLPEIVGLALGKEEAMEVVAAIAEETFQQTGKCDLRSFLSENEKKNL